MRGHVAQGDRVHLDHFFVTALISLWRNGTEPALHVPLCQNKTNEARATPKMAGLQVSSSRGLTCVCAVKVPH